MDVWKYGKAAGNVPVQVIPTHIFFNADGTPFTPSKTLAGQIQFGFVQRMNSSGRYQKAGKALKVIMGAAILLIGLYMFYLAF